MTGDLLVRPVRFTDDVEAMRRFLELVGLRGRIESERGGWVDLAARGGLVALHSAAGSATGGRPGETRLSFEVGDADGLCERLRAAGYDDATVYDEAYGRVLTLTDPLGDSLMLDERQDDLYGYRRLDTGPGDTGPSAVAVVPARFTDDAGGYHRFLTALGLVGEPAPGGYATYTCAGHGLVGVHPVLADEPRTQLSVLVADLEAVQAGLVAAGMSTRRVEQGGGPFLVVTDPDGQDVQLRTAS